MKVFDWSEATTLDPRYGRDERSRLFWIRPDAAFKIFGFRAVLRALRSGVASILRNRERSPPWTDSKGRVIVVRKPT